MVYTTQKSENQKDFILEVFPASMASKIKLSILPIEVL